MIVLNRAWKNEGRGGGGWEKADFLELMSKMIVLI